MDNLMEKGKLLTHVDGQLAEAQHHIAAARKMIAEQSDHRGLTTWMGFLWGHIQRAKKAIKASEIAP